MQSFKFYTIVVDGKLYRYVTNLQSTAKVSEFLGIPEKDIQTGASSKLPDYECKNKQQVMF